MDDGKYDEAGLLDAKIYSEWKASHQSAASMPIHDGIL